MASICLFGPDGSGKSTLALDLSRALSDKGKKVKVSWVRGTHTVASLIARFLATFPSLRGGDNPYYHITIPSKLRPLWVVIEFVSIIPLWIFRVMIPNLLGYVVLCERSMVDFIVWISVTTHYPTFISSFIGRITLALALRTSSNVYVRANLSTLKSRRQGETVPSLSLQLALYDLISMMIGSPSIDTTSKDVADSLGELLGIVDHLW